MRSDPAPVLRDAWTLATWVLERFEGSPDPVARRCCERSLDLVEGLAVALDGPPREARVEACLALATRLRLLLRLAGERGLLTAPQADHALERAAVVGRQLGGWLRHLRSIPPGDGRGTTRSGGG